MLTEAIAPTNVLENQKPLDIFSANLLLRYVSQPTGEKDMTVPFSWGILFNLDPYFESIRKDKLNGLNCDSFSNSMGRPKEVEFNCENTPNGKVPIKMSNNIVLYLSKSNRKLLKNLYLETTMPMPQKILYIFPGHPEVFLKFDVRKQDHLLQLEEVDLATQVNLVRDLLMVDISSKKQIIEPILLNTDHFDTSRAPKIDVGNEFKYFGEGYTIAEPFGSKVDYRFYDLELIEKYQLKNAKLQQLIRGWIHFSRIAGVNWWLTHSSLMGWYWNGFHLPFENRATAQVPIGDLFDKLIPHNQSIIFDYKDSTTGHYGSFFLDINPFSINAGNDADGKNKVNLVDARFIDMSTGLVLDISASRAFKPDGGKKGIHRELNLGDQKKVKKMIEESKFNTVLYDKEHNFTPLEEVLPLVPVHFDNELAFIPSHYSKILSDDSDKSLTRSSKSGFKFRSLFKLWIPIDKCRMKLPWMESTKLEDSACLKNNEEIRAKAEKFSYYMKRHLKEKKQIDVLIKNAKNYGDVSDQLLKYKLETHPFDRAPIDS